MLVDPFAHQIHADGGADRGDVPGAQELHNRGQGFDHILFGDDDLRMLAADIIRRHPRVLEVNGVDVHADGEGADRMRQHLLGDGADQGGIQTAGK